MGGLRKRRAWLILLLTIRNNSNAATVNSVPIYMREVERQVTRAARGRQLKAEAKKVLEAQALRQLIKRRLILRYLQRTGKGASDQEIALELHRVDG